MGVIVVSSDLIEIINLSNRIVVMRDGQAIKTLESDELTEENVMLYAMGVNADEKLKTNTQTKQRLVTLLDSGADYGDPFVHQ